MSDVSVELKRCLDRLEEEETEFMMLYSECKSIVGWPLCGERPKVDIEDGELDEDALRVLEKWLVVLGSQIVQWRAIRNSLKKKYKHYEGEKKVAVGNVDRGKPAEAFFERKRIIEL